MLLDTRWVYKPQELSKRTHIYAELSVGKLSAMNAFVKIFRVLEKCQMDFFTYGFGKFDSDFNNP